jgi:PilZ domain-containing protein
MQHQSDRRALGVQRVPVERIVDVCVATGVFGATFQGWSTNVSGRGMSVRSTHIPDLQAPLVVRFEEDGAEVIAEGEVAWRNETGSGAEFGVRFTALDSRSVQALKALCQFAALAAPAALQATAPQQEEHDTEPAPAATTGIKLHIEGLAAPMQGVIRQQGEQKVALGSPLDFLRVGRTVEVEDVALGERRGARIEAVDVRVDPESRVPELIVSLGYQATRTASPPGREPASPRARLGVNAPPPPASEPASDAAPTSGGSGASSAPVSDAAIVAQAATIRSAPERPAREAAPSSVARDRSLPADVAASPASGASPAAYAEEGDDADGADEVSMPLDPYETQDEDEPCDGPSLEIDESGGPSDAERLRQRLEGMFDGLSSAARVTSERCRKLGAAASQGAEWVALRTRDARRRLLERRVALPLRRTSAAPPPSSRAARTMRLIAPRSERQAGTDRRLPQGALLGVALVALALAGTWWGRGSPAAEPIAKPPARTAIQAAPGAAPSESPLPESPPAPSERPRLLVPPEEESIDGEPSALAQSSSLQVASTEPPSRGAAGSARSSVESRALARAVTNESLFEARPAPRKKAAPAPAPAPAEFASGRLQLPIIYRLRLDRPAEGLRGERTPTGFEVVIPGRKTLESGSAIARRDPRFAKVSTRNGPDGAHVAFRFRSSVPGYKVRLRKEYLEIFISAD